MTASILLSIRMTEKDTKLSTYHERTVDFLGKASRQQLNKFSHKIQLHIVNSNAITLPSCTLDIII